MKIIFFGSSEFSLSALEVCLEGDREVTLVISTPDKPQGRGLKMSPTPVSQYATKSGIPVVAPNSLRSEELLDRVKSLTPDIYVVSSYGKLIPEEWLSIPKVVPLNVHPSLLPLYRGASPLRWPIINGDRESGVSIARVTKDLDAGEIYNVKKYPLNETITSDELASELADLSKVALNEVISSIEQGAKLTSVPQDHDRMSYARKLTKEDGRLDWKLSAKDLVYKVRGLLPWPVAFSFSNGDRFQVISVEFAQDQVLGPSALPGEILSIEKSGKVVVKTGNGNLALIRVKPAGKKEMSATDFARGRRLEPGSIFKGSD